MSWPNVGKLGLRIVVRAIPIIDSNFADDAVIFGKTTEALSEAI